MKTFTKKLLIFASTVLLAFTTKAQVSSLYSFSQFTTSYTAITGGTAVATSNWDDYDWLGFSTTPANPPATGPGIPIGFNFIFNNIIYDVIAVSNNGYISLGNSANGSSAINTNILDWNRPISSSSAATATQTCKICPFATDLMGKSVAGSEIRVQTLGSAPTRTTVIQWSNYQRYNAAPTESDNINFQLRLNETTWSIDAIYGVVHSITEDSVAQVGLRGTSNSDFNNRIVNSSHLWNASIAGTVNSDNCRYNSTIYPAAGTVYHWEMPQCSGALAATSATANSHGICPGASFSVGLSPSYTLSGISYTWSVSNSSATGPYTVIPGAWLPYLGTQTISASTWYQMNATCVNGGSTVQSSPLNVTVAVPPSITAIASPTTLCSGSSLTLNVSGTAATHSWVGGYTSGVGFGATTSQNYSVIGTSVEGCTTMATVSVSVIQTPTLGIINSPVFVCAGSQATLSSPGASSYTWTSATQTVFTSSMIITPASAGISTYTVTKANGSCVDTKTTTITTYAVPNVFAIATPTRVCASNAASLAVAGGQSYTWTSPGNPPSQPSFTFSGANPIAFPPVGTNYTVVATDGTCTAMTTVSVAVDPNPTITIAPTATTICAGQSVSMTASGANNYTWTSTSNTGTLNTASISDTPTGSAAYTASGDNSFGCVASLVQVVLVTPNPTLATTVVANKTLVCNNGSSTITVGGASSYTWSYGTTTGNGGTVVVTSTNTTSGPVIYTVSGSYTTGCTSSKTVAINVFIPSLNVSGNFSTCVGGMIALNASGGSNNTYTWSVPGNSVQSTFSQLSTTLAGPAVFTVSAKTTSLVVTCPASKTVDVGLYPNPVITAVAQRTTICTKEHVVLTAGGGTAYTWNNGAQTMTINVAPTSNTTYTVTGTDTSGCVGTGTVQVRVSGCAGIEEQKAIYTGLIIYPNPSNGEFVIEAESDLNLALINELGQFVRSIVVNGNHKITVNDLPGGIYFLSGEKDGALIRQKIVVAR